MKLWSYVERNHKRMGCALFVLPTLLAPMAVIGLINAVVLLF
jgi:hypothetical protein